MVAHFSAISKSPSAEHLEALGKMEHDATAAAARVVRSAWWLIATGMLSGAVLGLWSFGGPVPAPPGFESYADVPRRLLRLSHIALIALPVIGLAYVRYVAGLSARTRAIGCRLWLFGMAGLPALLALTAVVPPVLYFLPFPVLSLSLAVVLLAHGLGRTEAAGAP